MPWMLLRNASRERPPDEPPPDEPPPDEPPPEQPACEPLQSGASPAPHRRVPGDSAGSAKADRRASEAASRPSTAWLLFGDAPESLFQAGACRILLERHGPPELVCAGGFSVVNAVLLAAGDPRRLERGWERLRRGRILFDRGLEALPLVRCLLGAGPPAHRLLAREALAAGLAAARTRVLIDGVVVAGHEGTPQAAEALEPTLRAALAERRPGLQTWSRALDGVLEQGPSRVLLVGAPEAAVSRLRETTRVRLEALRGELDGIACGFSAPVPTLGFLLPGSGLPERLVQQGERAARSWSGARGRDFLGSRLEA